MPAELQCLDSLHSTFVYTMTLQHSTLPKVPCILTHLYSTFGWCSVCGRTLYNSNFNKPKEMCGRVSLH